MTESIAHTDKKFDILPDGLIWEENKYNYTFIPDSKTYSNLKIVEIVQQNDVYEKYKVKANIFGELICCKDKTKISNLKNKIGYETYEEYINFISTYDKSRDQWIYNIIDGIAETSDILYVDEDIIIIPTYTWNKSDVEKLHVLAIVKDKNLRTIRDLNQSHIQLLKNIKNIGIGIISFKYSIQSDEINIYFHYEPSTYQLHAHFTNLSNSDFKNSVECSHHIDNVIFNLSLNSDYYKLINMVKRL